MAKRKNGEGTVKRRADGRYEAQVTIGFDPITGVQKRKSVYGRTPEEVVNKKNELLEKVSKEQFVEPEKITLKDWLERWLNTYVVVRVRGTTYDNYGTLIRKHIVPALGKKLLAKIRPLDIQQFYSAKMLAGRADGKVGGLSAKTIKEIHNILNRAYKDAILAGITSHNPVERTTPPKRRRYEFTPMTSEQVQRFLEVAKDDKLFTAFFLEFHTGLRRGELLGLRWCDVDLNNCVIRVLQSVVLKKGVSIIQMPKTEASKRTIPISAELISHLKEIKDKQSARECNDKGLDTKLIFSQPNDQPINPRGFTRHFDSLLKKACLPHFRFHDCRHTVATMLLTLGVHPKVAQAILGHSDIETTINTYSHLTPGLDVHAIHKLGDLLGTKKPSYDEEGKEQ